MCAVLILLIGSCCFCLDFFIYGLMFKSFSFFFCINWLAKCIVITDVCSKFCCFFFVLVANVLWSECLQAT